MTTASSAIASQELPGKPHVTYRAAGDRALLVEYGEHDFDLRLNFMAIAVADALEKRPLAGLIDAAPGFRSIIVSYDPLDVSTQAVLAHLEEIHARLDDQRKMRIPSRLIHLPIAFDEASSRQAVERYVNTIRKDAPNAEGGNNIDYIVRYNGLSSREELYEDVLTDQWSGFIGFFPGLPFLFPLDPRHAPFVPKYNPTRTWTAEGAVGVGGPCWAIYPVESAGGYQLVGRTLPIYDLQGRNEIFRENGMIMRAGDRIRFHRVEEDELTRLWEDVRSDRYRYRIEDGEFDVGAYLDWLPTIAAEAEERRARREAAAAATPVP